MEEEGCWCKMEYIGKERKRRVVGVKWKYREGMEGMEEEGCWCDII
jgi:hypothetical protein